MQESARVVAGAPGPAAAGGPAAGASAAATIRLSPPAGVVWLTCLCRAARGGRAHGGRGAGVGAGCDWRAFCARRPPSAGASAAATVRLSPPAGDVTRVPAWEVLAREQGEIDEERLENSKPGDVFALDDKNVLSMPWRHVFAVRDADQFAVYDIEGRLIVEASDGLPGGRQSVDELVSEFHVNGYYYRPGRVRNTPRSERLQSMQPEVVPLRVEVPDAVDHCAPCTPKSANGERDGELKRVCAGVVC